MSTSENNIIDKITGWYNANKKLVNRILTGVLILIVAFIAYKKFVVDPKNEKAKNAIYLAEQYFMDGNYELALNGQGATAPGFLSIMKKYSGTKQANLSRFYAGVCYLQTGKYDEAIDMLKKYKGKGSLLEYRAYGCIGDAYADKGNMKEAISYYRKASANPDDQVNAPMYLLREGILLEKEGQTDEAKKVYLKIRENYPSSLEGAEIDKYLARVGELASY